jgi:hypothetical protein
MILDLGTALTTIDFPLAGLCLFVFVIMHVWLPLWVPCMQRMKQSNGISTRGGYYVLGDHAELIDARSSAVVLALSVVP